MKSRGSALWWAFAGVLLAAGGIAGFCAEKGGPSRAKMSDALVREAIEKSLPYIERGGTAWMKEKKCVSCHQVTSMLWSLSAAKERGFDVDAGKLEEWFRWSEEKTREVRDDPKRNLAAENMIKLMLGRETYGGAEREKLFENFPGDILGMQKEDGHWEAGGQLPFQKRPTEETNEASTMWALLALANSGDGAVESRIKARAWLAKGGETSASTEWVGLKMILGKEFGEEGEVLRWRGELLKRQRDNGGWNWIGEKPSDALATGTALYFLSRVEGPGVKKAIRRGREFLVTTQGEEGHWVVPTTKNPKKGKPADEPTDVSNYWGSAWAVIGLASTLPE